MSHRKRAVLLPKCNQCGQCCIVLDNGIWQDCKYLIRYIDGEGSSAVKTRCAIYQHRLYAIVGKNQYCGKRIHFGYAMPNCPFNTPQEKTHPKYLSAM